MSTYSSRIVMLLVLATWLAGCGSELTLPRDSVPHQLDAVAGDGQRGTVGDQLPEPLIVRLTDASAQPVPRVDVVFQSDVPDIVVDPSVLATDDSGYARVHVRLGTAEGTQVVESRLAGASTPELTATFELIAREEPQGRGRDDGHRGHDGDEHD